MKLHVYRTASPTKKCSEIQCVTPQNPLWINYRVASMFKNVTSFSRSNLGLSVSEDSVHSLKLFRMTILLAPKGINEITEEHDEKKNDIE